MIIEVRGHHNECLARIDTRDYEYCEGIFIESTPPAGENILRLGRRAIKAVGLDGECPVIHP